MIITTTTLDDYYNNINKNDQIHVSCSPRLLPPITNIQVNFDGLCQPCNPGGTACFAFIIRDDKETIYRDYRVGAYDSTNNVAEYTGIIKALEWLLKNNLTNEKVDYCTLSTCWLSMLRRTITTQHTMLPCLI